MSFSAESYAAKAPDEVELIIGAALLTGDFGAKDYSESEKRAAARRWFRANLAQFRSLVCGNDAVKRTFSNESKDRNSLLSALADVLASRYGMQVPVAALAAQLVHFGLDKLCPSFMPVDE